MVGTLNFADMGNKHFGKTIYQHEVRHGFCTTPCKNYKLTKFSNKEIR